MATLLGAGLGNHPIDVGLFDAEHLRPLRAMAESRYFPATSFFAQLQSSLSGPRASGTLI